MLGALFAAALAAATGTGELKTFKDWTVGCDNGRACHAVGQYSAQNMEVISVSIARGAGATDAPKIWFRLQDSPAIDLSVDGKRLGASFVNDEENQTVTAQSAARVIDAFRTATKIELIGEGGKVIGQLSSLGASAAMLYMDEQQRRTGTVTALVSKGPKPASAVPRPPALPIVRRAGGSADPMRKLTAAQVRKVQQDNAECMDDDVSDKVEYARLDARTTLAIVNATCASGAYNFYGIPLLLRDNGKREIARFEGREGDDLVMNLSWKGKERLLESYFKGRGMGDCGGGSDWAWDGTRFRIVRSRMMDECLGATEWITTFRARVVDR
jgi:hypothetical protein